MRNAQQSIPFKRYEALHCSRIQFSLKHDAFGVFCELKNSIFLSQKIISLGNLCCACQGLAAIIVFLLYLCWERGRAHGTARYRDQNCSPRRVRVNSIVVSRVLTIRLAIVRRVRWWPWKVLAKIAFCSFFRPHAHALPNRISSDNRIKSRVR